MGGRPVPGIPQGGRCTWGAALPGVVTNVVAWREAMSGRVTVARSAAVTQRPNKVVVVRDVVTQVTKLPVLERFRSRPFLQDGVPELSRGRS